MEGGKDDIERTLENEIGNLKDTDYPNHTNDTDDDSREDERGNIDNNKEKGEDGEELGSQEKPNHDNTDFYFEEETTESKFVIDFWPR